MERKEILAQRLKEKQMQRMSKSAKTSYIEKREKAIDERAKQHEDNVRKELLNAGIVEEKDLLEFLVSTAGEEFRRTEKPTIKETYDWHISLSKILADIEDDERRAHIRQILRLPDDSVLEKLREMDPTLGSTKVEEISEDTPVATQPSEGDNPQKN